MFRKNDQHRQWPLFSSIDALPEKQQVRLNESWAGTFYDEFFCRIDEKPFAVLYSDDEASRPNTPVNLLLGFETLKAGFGWSDEEAYDHFCFDIQVRYAVGHRELSTGHFELRTVYNFRQRVAKHMQETGANLIDQAFEQVTDAQVAAFNLKTHKLRMDSTLIASNIRQTSRLQLLVEVLQRVHRMLDEGDQLRYAADFAAYLKGTAGQYIYTLKRAAYPEHLQRVGELMHQLVSALQAKYAHESAYQVLERVFEEHFVVDESKLRAKEGEELSAASLQSPDDWEASYRRKRGQDHRGYVTNVTETCDPDNPFQLIVKVQTASNNTDDAVLLTAALPGLKERTGVDEMHTDGGYNSAEVDAALQEQQVQQIQTAIRGRKPASEKLGLEDFKWQVATAEGQPHSATCPHGQQAEATAGRKEGCYRVAFDSAACASCPLRAQCTTAPLKRQPENVLRFSQQDLNVALRRQRCADERSGERHLRPAVEATARAIKHPFGNGKVPVRGNPRVSMVMTESAALNNVRQIHRYQISQNEAGRAEKGNPKAAQGARQQSVSSFFAFFWSQLRACFHLAHPLRSTWACSF